MLNGRPQARRTVAELFCGCGGFSHGFSQTGHFDVVLGNDIKGPALATFRENHGGYRGKPRTLKGDIREISIREIERALEDKGVDELDCLIGGPPCQGFSQVRRSEEREGSDVVKFRGYDRLAHDPRNDLVLRFLEIAHALKPKFIVIENVPQILRHNYNGSLGGLADAIFDMLGKEMGYDVEVDVLNAANYGVPQLRERAIILASRVGTASLPAETHAEPGSYTKLLPWVTVADAIGDLPPPPLNKDKLGGGPAGLYIDDPSEYALSLRGFMHFPYNHITRRYSKRIISIIEQMRPGETWDHESERLREEYELIIKRHQVKEESREDTIERLAKQGLVNPAFYKDYYWSAYTRLAWERPALTITANANFLGSGRFTHPTENRGITVREAARLQSFNDDFRFITSEDDLSDTERIGVGMDMIGEAVPPLLGKAIAEHILKLMKPGTEAEVDAKPRRERDGSGHPVKEPVAPEIPGEG